ncbi:hypothetical protein TRVA0_008S00232 [Trichomonascus vanleenenianus]|uniref:uncharacterized protein n=1 Tax=Trichomonascus vanleenenianus TaxID=2268995 RepID=UPI003EC9543E
MKHVHGVAASLATTLAVILFFPGGSIFSALWQAVGVVFVLTPEESVASLCGYAVPTLKKKTTRFVARELQALVAVCYLAVFITALYHHWPINKPVWGALLASFANDRVDYAFAFLISAVVARNVCIQGSAASYSIVAGAILGLTMAIPTLVHALLACAVVELVMAGQLVFAAGKAQQDEDSLTMITGVHAALAIMWLILPHLAVELYVTVYYYPLVFHQFLSFYVMNLFIMGA